MIFDIKKDSFLYGAIHSSYNAQTTGLLDWVTIYSYGIPWHFRELKDKEIVFELLKMMEYPNPEIFSQLDDFDLTSEMHRFCEEFGVVTVGDLIFSVNKLNLSSKYKKIVSNIIKRFNFKKDITYKPIFYEHITEHIFQNEKIEIYDLANSLKNFFSIFSEVLPIPDPQKISILLLDEPEISLHMQWQEEIGKFLKNSLSVNTICATHSSSIIQNNWDYVTELSEQSNQKKMIRNKDRSLRQCANSPEFLLTEAWRYEKLGKHTIFVEGNSDKEFLMNWFDEESFKVVGQQGKSEVLNLYEHWLSLKKKCKNTDFVAFLLDLDYEHVVSNKSNERFANKDVIICSADFGTKPAKIFSIDLESSLIKNANIMKSLLNIFLKLRKLTKL